MMWHSKDTRYLFILGVLASVGVIITLFPVGSPWPHISSAWCPHFWGLFWHPVCVWEPHNVLKTFTWTDRAIFLFSGEMRPQNTRAWGLWTFLTCQSLDSESKSCCGFLPNFSVSRICVLWLTAKGQLVACLYISVNKVHGNLRSAVKCASWREQSPETQLCNHCGL